MTTRLTPMLSQTLSGIQISLCSRVRWPSWNAPALWSFPPRHIALKQAPPLIAGTLGTLLFALFITLASANAQALKIELVSEHSAIIPGQPTTLGLWLQHGPGQHTYWRFPGIVGVPTQMDWKLPPGWKASPLIYPEPERTFMYQIKAQGFDRDVMLRTDLTPPADLKPGTQVTLTGTASWMCCGNSCHPGSQEFSITLPVATTAKLNEKWHRLLEQERARAEQPSDAWTATAIETGTEIIISLKPATPAARLSQDQQEAEKIIPFTEDGWFDTDEPQTVRRHPDGSLTITVTKADAYLGNKPPETLRAILRNESGWLQNGKLRCLQINPKVERPSGG